MLKTLTVTFFCCSFAIFCSAQLADSKWKATLDIESGIDVLLSFGTDTLQVFSSDDEMLVETMTYSYQDSTITIIKVDGQSDCEPGKSSKYSLLIKGDSATFKAVEDSCDTRKWALDNVTMHKKE